MSLIEEIQAGALDRTVPVSDLLRRVKLAAAKLKLTGTLEWVESELNGYCCDDKDMPSYRIASGTLMAHSQWHGTRLAHGDPNMIAAMSVSFFREPIGSIEACLADAGGHLTMPVDLSLAKMVSQSGVKDTFQVYFSKNVAVAIADSVRNLVLDWAIKLEAEGILGEGVSFTMEEKKKAAEAGSVINITNHGGIVQTGDTHGNQNRATIGTDLSHNAFDVFDQVQTAISNQVENPADREALLALIKQLESEKKSTSYRATYERFLSAAANYMTILSPFLPALSSHLPG